MDCRTDCVCVLYLLHQLSLSVLHLQVPNPKALLHSGILWPNVSVMRGGRQWPCRTRYMNWTELSVGTTSTANTSEVRLPALLLDCFKHEELG